MKTRIAHKTTWLAIMLTTGAVCAQENDGIPAAAREQARQILKNTGVTGGLVVHVGCDDPAALAALRPNEAFTAVALESDPAKIAATRKWLGEKNLHGAISVFPWKGGNLPFADNLVNLVVQSSRFKVQSEEVERALAPRGVWIQSATPGSPPFRKPVPPELDDWPQYFYSATGNAVSRDTAVGPPRSLQWWAGPFSERSHNWVNSAAAMVSAAGRVFYIYDEGPISAMPHQGYGMNWPGQKLKEFPEMPEEWSLIGRDAFNGKRLWRRALQGFGGPEFEDVGFQPSFWNIWSAPLSLNRRTAASPEMIFATLDYRGGMSALDAATGRTVWEYKPEGFVDEIVFESDTGRLYLRVRGEIPRKRSRPFKDRISGSVEYEKYVLEQKPEQIVCLQAKDGKVLWTCDTPHVAVETLCAGFGKVCFFDMNSLVCLDAATGKKVWNQEFGLRKATPGSAKERGNSAFGRGAYAGQLLLWENKAFFFPAATARTGAHCFNLDDGAEIWSGKRLGPSGGFGHPTGVWIVGDTIWNVRPEGFAVKTGEAVGRLAPGPLGSTHGRCHRGVATVNYILGIAFGVEFYDIAGKALVSDNRWLRSACAQGYMPANGMLYNTPDPCACWIGARIRGFHAMGPKEPALDYDRVDETERLEKGPAYAEKSSIINHQSSISEAWPTYRHDARRSGRAYCAVPAELKVAWQSRLGSPYDWRGYNLVSGLTPPTVADGKVFIARKDVHEVVCLNAADGKILWRYPTSTPVTSPPTLHAGRAIFGCTDGYVYSLRVSDGVLAWRFRAAPADMLVLYEGRPGSKWPAQGAALVQDGAVYVTAGYSSFLDGGIHFFKLDPATGQLLAHARGEGPRYPVYQPNPFDDPKAPKKGKAIVNPDGYHGIDIEGHRADILVSDGTDIRMGQTRITPDLKISSTLREQAAGTAIKRRWLRPMYNFLDDTYNNRLGWHYADTYRGMGNATGAANAGKILVFDDAFTYAVEWDEGPGVTNPKTWTDGRYPNHIPGDGSIVISDAFDTPNAQSGFAVLREEPPRWHVAFPMRIQAMVLAATPGADGQTLFVAGPTERKPGEPNQLDALRGQGPGQLVALSAADGRVLSELPLEAAPVFDGLAAADGKLFVALTDGTVVCLSVAMK